MLETNFCVCLTVAHIGKRLGKKYRTPVTYLRSYAMTQKMLLNMYLFTTTNNQQPKTITDKLKSYSTAVPPENCHLKF